MLQRNQLKFVFGGYEGGYGGTYEYLCKNSNTGAEWFDSVSSCEDCGCWCDTHVPASTYYTSWICSGPLVGGGYGY
ncbi:hypothetical protein GCM10022395_34420 [Snuella lapsa]|uniref:Uncharacterized protein n=2 Tax=Snuella lapsa TaxID=870481 RepID=A0ABP6YGK6_9FLAO